MNKINCMISANDNQADSFICHALLKLLKEMPHLDYPLIFFCIGTPKVPGDALGPYIGTLLQELHLPNCIVYGTWKKPIHALNLSENLMYAKKKHPGSCFIAIDASFGPPTHLGNIYIENRPIYPGRGVGKDLPPVGHIAITSIICPNCKFRQKRLAKVSFSHMQCQAHPILHGIFQALFYLFYFK